MSHLEYYTPKDLDTLATYSEWVEDKIITAGETRLVENTLGLVGEAGEVAEKIKKMIRDNKKVTNGEIALEIGDVLFYAAALGNYLGYTFDEIIEMNVNKLDSREKRGVLQGDGDNR